MINKDVIFDEENTWDWNEKQSISIIVYTEVEDGRQQPLTVVPVGSTPPNEVPIVTEIVNIQ